MKVALVAAARPNFMKVAAVHEALCRRAVFDLVLVHARQHRDAAMGASFFDQLGLPAPNATLDVDSSSHARQTAEVMIGFERWVQAERPALVVVVGDVNATLACALVAAKENVPLAHVEAGLRSRDRSMPEEVNRILVDAVAELLFASEPAAVENLRAEGAAAERIHFVGNTMIDTLLRHAAAARASDVLARLGVREREAVVATLHRPANVDDAARLAGLVEALAAVARDAPVVLPLHPRTRARIVELGLEPTLASSGIRVTEPLPYLDFVHLMATARLVLTDSGGVQEETTVLGVPCLTLRENTERPITLTEGTNRLVGTRPAAILEAWRDVRDAPARAPARPPERWDGKAGERIADALEAWARER